MSSQPQPAFSSESDGTPCTPEQRRALDNRFTELYDKIKRLAARVRWSGANPTLNPTALAHEAYLKLRDDSTDFGAKSHEQAISIFANAMHQILIDAARRKGAQKRAIREMPEERDLPIEDALSVAEAIAALERENPIEARIAQSRFLLGMTVEETAAALEISKRSVERHWAEAKQKLLEKIGPPKR